MLGSACGRTGFDLPGPLPPEDVRIAEIVVPASMIAHAGCAAPVELRIVDGNGASRAEEHEVDVWVDRAHVIAPGWVGPAGKRVRVRTGIDGIARVSLVLQGSGDHSGLSEVVQARVARHDTTSKATLPLVPNQPPTIAGDLDADGDGVLEGTTELAASVTGSATLFAFVTDPDAPVDPARVRWAATDPLLDLDGDLDGDAGGAQMRVRVPLGLHAVVAEYRDCAGAARAVSFRVEGGTRLAREFDGDQLGQDDVNDVDADRAVAGRAYMGFAQNQGIRRITVDATGTPTVDLISTTAAPSARLRWSSNATGRLLVSWTSSDGVQEIDGGAATVAQSYTSSPYDTAIRTLTVCTDGRAYASRTVLGLPTIYPFPSSNGGTLLATGGLTALEARPAAPGTCDLFGGNDDGFGWIDDDSGGLDLLRVWDQPVDASAVGFVGAAVWVANPQGIWTIDDPAVGDFRLVWAGEILPSAELPLGFAADDVRALLGATIDGTPTLLVGNAGPEIGQEGLLRLVSLAPRDAAGRQSAARWVPLPLREPLLVERGVKDVALVRSWHGDATTAFPLWAATVDGLVYLTWTP